MKSSKQPTVRFPGFNDDWEQRKLKEVADRYDNLRIPIVANLRVPGSTPYYGANGIQDYVDGYTHEGEYILVAEDGASDLKNYPVRYVKGRIWVNNHAHVLQSKIEIAENKFLSYAISQINMESFLVGGSRAKLNAEILMNINLYIPTMKEQKRIGTYLINFDNLIDLHQRELELLKQTKQMFLQKMFPIKEKNIPNIRFFGFDDNWDTQNFYNILENIIDYRGRTPKKLGLNWSEEGYLALSALNVKNGYIDLKVNAHYGDENLYNIWMGKNELKKGQVLFTTEAPAGNVAQVPDNKGYILSQRVIAFQVNEDKMNNDFLAILLRSLEVVTKLKSLSSGGTAKGVSQKSLKQLKVMIPTSLDEQIQIGNFFKQFDELISIQEQEIELLKQTKESFLQKMFI